MRCFKKDFEENWSCIQNCFKIFLRCVRRQDGRHFQLRP